MTYIYIVYLDVLSVNNYIVYVDVGNIVQFVNAHDSDTDICVYLYRWITANIGIEHQSINQYIYIVYLDVRLLGQSTFHPPVQQMQIHPQSFIQPQKQRFVNKKCIIDIKFSVHHMFVE